MSCALAFDTSNYTTSLAVASDGRITENRRIPVPVAAGARGVRQSDAVFHHTVGLAQIAEGLTEYTFDCVGVSTRPRAVEGSYMPCFLSGTAGAHLISDLFGLPLYEFSHQQGHIMAALYSAGRRELYDRRILAFHLSGGTTEMLLCERGDIRRIGGTLDISVGKLIDRTGVKLGMAFPCGAQLERVAEGEPLPQVRVKMTGCDCNLSGFENKIDQMIAAGEPISTVCAYTLACVRAAVEGMLEQGRSLYADLPILFGGGVSANAILRSYFTEKFGAIFPEAAFATDNAAGIALLAQREHDGR